MDGIVFVFMLFADKFDPSYITSMLYLVMRFIDIKKFILKSGCEPKVAVNNRVHHLELVQLSW